MTPDRAAERERLQSLIRVEGRRADGMVVVTPLRKPACSNPTFLSDEAAAFTAHDATPELTP